MALKGHFIFSSTLQQQKKENKAVVRDTMEDPTSTIEFYSTLHGEQRRRERGLNKRDLQAAVKHGKKERGHSGRWKYTFADVVYITDSTSTEEVTSYSLPLPLDKIDIHPTELQKINEQQRRILTGIPVNARSDACIQFSLFHFFRLFQVGLKLLHILYWW